jgi:hypothetical protein
LIQHWYEKIEISFAIRVSNSAAFTGRGEIVDQPFSQKQIHIRLMPP